MDSEILDYFGCDSLEELLDEFGLDGLKQKLDEAERKVREQERKINALENQIRKDRRREHQNRASNAHSKAFKFAVLAEKREETLKREKRTLQEMQHDRDRIRSEVEQEVLELINEAVNRMD